MLGEFLEHVGFHSEIEFLYKRTVVGGSNNSQAFQCGCIQHGMFVAPSQGRSPLLLRTPAYQYREFPSSVKQRLSPTVFLISATKPSVQLGIHTIM